MDLRLAEEALVRTHAALAGMHWFLQGGALLGAVRDGALFSHDHDIDVALFLHDSNPALVKQRLTAQGLAFRRSIVIPGGTHSECMEAERAARVRRDSGISDAGGPRSRDYDHFREVQISAEQSLGRVDKFYYRDTILLDVIYWKDLSAETGFYEFWAPFRKVRHFWMKPHGITTIKFLDREFPVPDPVDEWLEQAYGPDWRTPMEQGWRAHMTPNSEHTPDLDGTAVRYERKRA